MKIINKIQVHSEEPLWQFKVGHSVPQPLMTGRASCQYLHLIGKPVIPRGSTAWVPISWVHARPCVDDSANPQRIKLASMA